MVYVCKRPHPDHSNFHKLWRRPRGMFFTTADKGHMAAMVYNWPQARGGAAVAGGAGGPSQLDLAAPCIP